MFVASAQVEVILYEAQSLKEKRQIIKSIIKRIQNQYNVSIAEVDLMDIWQRSILGLACVSNSPVHAKSQIDHIIRYMESDGRFEVGQVDIEIL